jgi:hypothetical protein
MADWTGGATGALGGASTGATIGSVIPGVGTALGAGIGGLFGGVAGLFGSGKKKKKKISSLDKRQKELSKQQYNSFLGKGPLADLYNYDPQAANAVFDQNFARHEYRNLEEKSIPLLTGQFRSAGLMNSSYVQEKISGERAKYLYNEQSNARDAKRNALENYQNRQNFAYDTSPGANASSLDQILASINQGIDAYKKFNPKGNNPEVPDTSQSTPQQG